MIDRIENHVGTSVDYVEEAKKELIEAEIYQKKARKVRLYFSMVSVMIGITRNFCRITMVFVICRCQYFFCLLLEFETFFLSCRSQLKEIIYFKFK